MFALLRWMARWPLALSHALGVAMGWFIYTVSPTYRGRLNANVSTAGYDIRVARRAVAHAGRMAGELPSLWLRARNESLGARVVHVEGIELAQAALNAGRGLVLMTPHLGAFEVAAQHYAERFGATHPMTAMYRPARQAWLREVQRTARDRPGLVTAPASLAGIRQMMKALRLGETVGLLPDQVPPDGMGVWAPFFGRPAYTMTLAARLIQQTGAAALLLTCERLAHGRGYALRYEALTEPLPAPPERGASPAHEHDHQVACASAINRAMEMMIRRLPDQYLWGYHRHKQPRPGVATSAPDNADGGQA